MMNGGKPWPIFKVGSYCGKEKVKREKKEWCTIFFIFLLGGLDERRL